MRVIRLYVLLNKEADRILLCVHPSASISMILK